MDLEKKWHKAIQETEILKTWLSLLHSNRSTDLPYIFLAESQIDSKDTVVRKGIISVDKPLIILPHSFPQFEGFELEENQKNIIQSFLLIRGINLPSLKFKNKTYSVNISENPLKKVIEYYSKKLEKKEDIISGLIKGNDEVWQFSLLIYVASLMSKSAPYDIQNFLENLRRRIADN